MLEQRSVMDVTVLAGSEVLHNRLQQFDTENLEERPLDSIPDYDLEQELNFCHD